VAAVAEYPADSRFPLPADDLLLAAAAPAAIVTSRRTFVAPHDIHRAAEKVASTGNSQVVNHRARLLVRTTTWWWICAASRSCAMPGGRWCSMPPTACNCRSAGAVSGGSPQFIEPLARAAVAVGVSGISSKCTTRRRRPFPTVQRAAARSAGRNSGARLQAIDGLVKSLVGQVPGLPTAP